MRCQSASVWAIDPGTASSALVITDALANVAHRKEYENDALLAELKKVHVVDELLAVEMIASYGMPVGREVFETCVWIGRFAEAWGGRWRYVYRREVKMLLCNNNAAKDGNVRQALIDKYPPTGGGKTPQIGTKKQPGPLYGFKSHLWSALGVAHAAIHAEGRNEV